MEEYKILEIIDNTLALAGYKVIDGYDCDIIIRNAKEDADYEIKVTRIAS